MPTCLGLLNWLTYSNSTIVCIDICPNVWYNGFCEDNCTKLHTGVLLNYVEEEDGGCNPECNLGHYALNLVCQNNCTVIGSNNPVIVWEIVPDRRICIPTCQN